MPPLSIDYSSLRDVTPRLPRLRITLGIAVALLSATIAFGAARRAVEQWSVIQQSGGVATGCVTCANNIKHRLNVRRASFADHLSIFVFTSGASLVGTIGAVRSFNSLRGARMPH